MNHLEAIEAVLKTATEPMSAKAIADEAVRRGLITEYGKTLHASFSRDLNQNIAKGGSVFMKVAAGRFALAGSAVARVRAEVASGNESKEEEAQEARKSSRQKRRGGGYVYILTNPCFNAYFKSKIVKIGQAKDVEKRRATLNTSVPVQFEIFATLWTSKYKIVEKKIHQKLKGVSAIKELHGGQRVKAENGEFYLITPAQALKVLQDESELIDEKDKIWDLRGRSKKNARSKTICTCSSWKNPTQLAKFLATQGGNVKAAGGILQQLTGRRRVVKDSKWRKPMEAVGVRFNSDDMVVGW